MPRSVSEAELTRHEGQLADDGYTVVDRLLGNAETNAALAAMQPLHRDDAYFPVNPHPPLVVNTMWALTDFTQANGATRIVPGSHLVGDPVDPAAASIPVEMPRGSVLLWDGQMWHGGGANLSSEIRFGLSLNYCRGWIRQQENQYLSLNPAMVASLPQDVQKLLGYDICQFVGWADGRHPMRAILPDVRARIHLGDGGRRGTH